MPDWKSVGRSDITFLLVLINHTDLGHVPWEGLGRASRILMVG